MLHPSIFSPSCTFLSFFVFGFLCIPSKPLQIAGTWQLESHPEIYAGYVPMDYRDYLGKMSKWVFLLLSIYNQMLSYNNLNVRPHFVLLKQSNQERRVGWPCYFAGCCRHGKLFVLDLFVVVYVWHYIFGKGTQVNPPLSQVPLPLVANESGFSG